MAGTNFERRTAERVLNATRWVEQRTNTNIPLGSHGWGPRESEAIGAIFHIGTADGEIAAGETDATIKLHRWSDAEEDGTETLTGVRFDWIHEGDPIADGLQVIVVEQDGVRRIVGVACP